MMSLNLKDKEKKKILNFIADFKETVRKKDWISHYDRDSDSLVMRVPKLSTESRKRYINDEFAFYMDAKSDIQGIFIEYFITNLVLYNKKDLKKFSNLIKSKEKNTTESLIELKKTDTTRVASGLETVILNSIVESMPSTA